MLKFSWILAEIRGHYHLYSVMGAYIEVHEFDSVSEQYIINHKQKYVGQ